MTNKKERTVPDSQPSTETPSWALQKHYKQIKEVHLSRLLFANDPHRGEHFAVEAPAVLGLLKEPHHG